MCTCGVPGCQAGQLATASDRWTLDDNWGSGWVTNQGTAVTQGTATLNAYSNAYNETGTFSVAQHSWPRRKLLTTLTSATNIGTDSTPIWFWPDSSLRKPWYASNANSALTTSYLSQQLWKVPNIYVPQSDADADWQASASQDTVYTRWAAIQHETAEQRAERAQRELAERERWEAQRLASEARYAAERVEREKANSRAETLLRENLTPEQLEELTRSGYFHLDTVSANGQRKRYRIRRGRAGNVHEVDDHGRVLRKLCVHPIEQVPDADTMLAQKLWLEAAESQILRVANITEMAR